MRFAIIAVLVAACGKPAEPGPACVERELHETFTRPRVDPFDLVVVVDGELGPLDRAALDVEGNVATAHFWGRDYRVIVASAESADVVGLALAPSRAAGQTAANRVRDAARRGGTNRVFDAAVAAAAHVRPDVNVVMVVLSSREDASVASAAQVPAQWRTSVFRPQSSSPRLRELAMRGADADVSEVERGALGVLTKGHPPAPSFTLAARPRSGSLRVWIDGVEVDDVDSRGATSWTETGGVLELSVLASWDWDSVYEARYSTECP